MYPKQNKTKQGKTAKAKQVTTPAVADKGCQRKVTSLRFQA
jgi:hypothetical protein